MTSLFNFIDGRSSEGTKELLAQISPLTLKETRLFVHSDFMDVVAAVQSANKAKKKWQETSAQERKRLLKRLGELIQEHFDLFIQYECEDSGIPLEASRKLCKKAVENYQECIEFEKRFDLKSRQSVTQFQLSSPVGVVGIVTDWQQSFLVILENLAISLTCANLVILNPSEFGMRSALKLAELAVLAQIPAGVFNVLLGRGESLAVHLVEHPGIKHVRFYGENSVGEKLHKLAAENQKRMTSVMGVNNTAIVFSDSNLKESIDKILELGCEFHLYGRNRINRILVQEKILEAFKLEFGEQLAGLNKSVIGPLPSVQLTQQFESYLAQSKIDRAKVYLSMSLNSENQVPLTIYEDLTNCSTLHQQDLIGPILFLQSFKYAVDLAKVLNSGTYASTAYIWTNDIVRIHKISQQLELARIFFNPRAALVNEDSLYSTILKQSGLGSDGREALFDFNLNTRTVQIG